MKLLAARLLTALALAVLLAACVGNDDIPSTPPGTVPCQVGESHEWVLCDLYGAPLR